VLVVSRNEAIPVLSSLVVAPVTSTIRPIPTCIPVGPDEGIDHDSVVTFDHMAAVPKRLLTIRLGTLGPSGHSVICSALRALADC
jgi:mRNA interferase MazF